MKNKYSFFLSLGILLFLIWISLNSGIVKLNGVIALLLGHGQSEQILIAQEIRGPRVLAAILVGATLGIAGGLSQGALRNPLAEPVLLGTTGGAALATLLGILFFQVEIGSFPTICMGIIGALLATILTFRIGKESKGGFAFIIIGIAISASLTAFVGLISVVIDKPEARGITFWSLGTLSMVTKNQVLLLIPILLICWLGAYWVAPKLDYLALGDIRAKHLNVDPSKVRLFTFMVIAFGIGAITSIFGQISFLALAIPHIVRALISFRHRALIVHSALLGAITLLVADLAARTLVSPNELPIGLMTALIGSPVLIISVKNWNKSHA